MDTMPPVETEDLLLRFGAVYPDGCIDATIVVKSTGEAREQSLWCGDRWPRGWRETAARRMRRMGPDDCTPQRCINQVPREARTDPACIERGNRIGRGEPAVA